jgi:hypothetical protein
MPLLDRTNRMLIRNLKAIKELRQGQVPAVAIGRADHVTVTNRTNVRLRPVKTELSHAVSEPVARISEKISDTIDTIDTIEARPDIPRDDTASAPASQSGGG